MKHSNHQKPASPLVLSRQRTNVPRNAFKMDFHQDFNCPVGLLVPTYLQEVKPNDFLTVDVSNFCRTVPCNTATFARMTEYTDFFYVPYSQLWKPLNQLINPVPDVNSALSLASQKNNTVQTVPMFTVQDIMDVMQLTEKRYDTGSGESYMVRLLDMLGYYHDPSHTFLPDPKMNHMDSVWLTNIGNALPDMQAFSPFRILAFNKIISDYYRQSDYTNANPMLFNIDDLESGSRIPVQRLANMFHIWSGSSAVPDYSIYPFCKWNLDKIIAVKPGQLYGSFNNPTGVNSHPSASFALVSNNGSVHVDFSSVSHGVSSTQDMRVARALEKLARVSMSAPKTFREQQKAHFGIAEQDSIHSVRYLGSYRSDLEVGEVTATSNYEGSSNSNFLGEVAGKGTSRNQRNGVIKFHSDGYGIVMGIHYVKPDAEYTGNRLDPFVTMLNRSQFYCPEFDNLGLEPVLGSASYLNKSTNNNVVGYASRYWYYKSRVNEVHGNFGKGRSFSPWAIARNSLGDSVSLYSMNRFFVDPNVTDTIFKVNYNHTEANDQFICHYRYDSTLVSDMSVNGTPIL